MEEIHFTPEEKRVAQVHAERKRRGVRQILVSYIGYPEKFTEWIDAWLCLEINHLLLRNPIHKKACTQDHLFGVYVLR